MEMGGPSGPAARGHPLAPARRLARVLDELVRVPGTRASFGLDALLGLVPGVGDVVTGGLSAYLLLVATRMGAPPSVIARMTGNVLIDVLLGAVPLVGDLFDAGWKANVRNLRLLEKLAADPEGARRSSRAVLAAALAVIFGAVLVVAWVVVRLVRWVVGLV